MSNKLQFDLSIFDGKDLSALTKKQRAVVTMALSGKTNTEIAMVIGCSRQNISLILQNSVKRILNPPIKKEPPPKNGPRVNYENYRNRDLSILAHAERETLLMKLNGMNNSEIAAQLGIKNNTVSNNLSKARQKLDGTFDAEKQRQYARDHYKKDPKAHYEKVKKVISNNKEKYSNYGKKYYQEHKEYFKNYFKEYDKKYYQEHREEKLRKQKERDKRKRENHES